MVRYLPLLGHILIGFVGVVLCLAGVLKLVGVGAEDMVEGLEKARLLQHQTTISITAIFCGVLLFVPVTRRLGYLMASAYWGGAIVAHMTYDDSPAMPAAFMAMLCCGIFLAEKQQRASKEPAPQDRIRSQSSNTVASEP